jgi:hypothetical protein
MSDLPMRDSVPLGEWLAVATRKLSAESVEHVREEIEEHFTSAKEEALAAGVHPHDTGLSALVSLGDPKAAHRACRKVLLTKAEERLLRNFKSKGPRMIGVAAGCLVLALVWIVAVFLPAGFQESPHENELTLLLVFVYLALALRPWITSKRNQTNSRIFFCFYVVCGAGSLFLLDSPQLHLGHSVLLIVAVMACWLTIRRRQQLRRKLPIDKWPDDLF